MLNKRHLLLIPFYLFFSSLFALETGEIAPVEIQKYLRFSYALQEGELTGKLRSGDQNRIVPFWLSMKGNTVGFRFIKPAQTVSMVLSENGNQLYEWINGKTQAVPSQMYHQKVRGTEVTYEDLAMRFLYWPKPQLIKEERIKFQKCWLLRIFNPGNLGPYRAVDVWVDQKSGAILQMKGYDFKTGDIIKQFKVISAQKHKGGYILEKMRIETFKPGNARFPVARTYLEIDKPK